jgi:hypothetical protein
VSMPREVFERLGEAYLMMAKGHPLLAAGAERWVCSHYAE